MKAQEVSLLEISSISKDFVTYKKEKNIFKKLISLVNPTRMDKRVIDNINFSIQKGDIVGYVGKNGAGKSTTVKMMCGILYPTLGEVNFNGESIFKDKKTFNKQIGVVFGQKTQLWWDLPLEETFKVLKEIYDIDDESFVTQFEELSKLLELDKFINVPVRQMSLGQRMRADLAAAFLHNPKLLFLDEPLIGLDIIVKEKIRNFIKYINEKYKTTIILTTHNMEEIESLCNRIIILDEGKIYYDGSIEILKKKIPYYKELNIEFEEGEDLNKLNFEKSDNIDINTQLNAVSIKIKNRDELIDFTKYFLDNYKLTDISIKNISLEEILKVLWTL